MDNMDMEIFVEKFQLFSIPQIGEMQKSPIQYGGKVYVPPSFKRFVRESELLILKLVRRTKIYHCTVMGFTALEETIVAPEIVLDYFEVDEGDLVKVYIKNLDSINYVCLEMPSYFKCTDMPERIKIQEILNSFDCLTKGQYVNILYKNDLHPFLVTKTEPHTAGVLIHNNYIFDIIPPSKGKCPSFLPFSGKGYTLSGKVVQRLPMIRGRSIEDDEMAFIQQLRSGPFPPFCGKGYRLGEEGEGSEDVAAGAESNEYYDDYDVNDIPNFYEMIDSANNVSTGNRLTEYDTSNIEDDFHHAYNEYAFGDNSINEDFYREHGRNEIFCDDNFCNECGDNPFVNFNDRNNKISLKKGVKRRLPISNQILITAGSVVLLGALAYVFTNYFSSKH